MEICYLQGTIYVRYVQSHSRKTFRPEAEQVNWSESNTSNVQQGNFGEEEDILDNGMIDMFPVENPELNYEHSVEIETGSDGMSKADESFFADQEICVVFICGDKTSVPHQVGFHRYACIYHLINKNIILCYDNTGMSSSIN